MQDETNKNFPVAFIAKILTIRLVRCQNVVNTNDHKQILAKKGLCLNCATKFHRASNCNSKTSCGHCNRRHHCNVLLS